MTTFITAILWHLHLRKHSGRVMVTTGVAWHLDPCRVRGPAQALFFEWLIAGGESCPLVRGDGRRGPHGAVPRPTEGSPLARQLPRLGSISISRKVTVLVVGGSLCLTATGTAAALGRTASPASPIAVADVLYVHSQADGRAAQPAQAVFTSQIVIMRAAARAA